MLLGGHRLGDAADEVVKEEVGVRGAATRLGRRRTTIVYIYIYTYST